MRKGKLTKEEAVELLNEQIVMDLDTINCEPTSRCQTDGDNSVEFTASVFGEYNGEDYTLTAYYYIDKEDLDNCGDDLSNLDWTIEGYEID